jgi:2-polyprenyl-6-methoxyphenol hydroxylase-like FAD-dependent oxidoreductase
MLDVRAENQILIVGAGPSGLALAAELKRRGVDVAIVDQQPAGANTSRACVVHARTMEVLQPLGVIRDLLAEGVKVPVFCVRDRNRSLLTVDSSDIPSFYRFTLMIPQNRIEQILLQHLERPWLQCCAAMQADPLRGVAVAGGGATPGQRIRTIDQGAVADCL